MLCAKFFWRLNITIPLLDIITESVLNEIVYRHGKSAVTPSKMPISRNYFQKQWVEVHEKSEAFTEGNFWACNTLRLQSNIKVLWTADNAGKRWIVMYFSDKIPFKLSLVNTLLCSFIRSFFYSLVRCFVR